MASRPLNRFLATLPADAYARLEPALRMLRVVSGSPLPHCGETRVYFPESGACSIFSSVADGRSIEVASVGNEGVLGLPQLALGSGLRVSWRHIGDGVIRYAPLSLIRDLSADADFEAQCHAYLERFTRQVMQWVACHQLHSLASRCATWILLSHDRLHRARFELTQPFLAQAMGVEAKALQPVMDRLSERQIIKYDKTTITVHDRIALGHLSCSCYAVLRPSTPRTLPLGRSIDEAEPGTRGSNVVAIRPAATCTLCGLGRGVPHQEHLDCLRAIDADLLSALQQVRSLTEKRKHLLKESLWKYRRLIKEGAIAR